MTYLELYEDALRKLHNSLITLGEFEMMVKPLNREVETDVVRCKDCRYWENGCKEFGNGIVVAETGEADFCSFGERKHE